MSDISLSTACLIIAAAAAAFLFSSGSFFPTWSGTESFLTARSAMQIEMWLELVITPLLAAIVFALKNW